jgi:hypothetical protein
MQYFIINDIPTTIPVMNRKDVCYEKNGEKDCSGYYRLCNVL